MPPTITPKFSPGESVLCVFDHDEPALNFLSAADLTEPWRRRDEDAVAAVCIGAPATPEEVSGSGGAYNEPDTWLVRKQSDDEQSTPEEFHTPFGAHIVRDSVGSDRIAPDFDRRACQTIVAKLSVHCIDVGRALPADGMRIVISRVDEDMDILSDAVLDEFGVLSPPLEIACGVYEVTFHIGDFYRASGIELAAPTFLEQVPFRFGVADDAAHYHLPLKFTPWGFSLFRGG